MLFTPATTFIKRDGIDITGNATAINEICGTPDEIDRMGLRIGAIFIILVTSLFGTMFPVSAKRIPTLRRSVPTSVFDFAKYFGSGVILTTAFIHLLEPAADEEINGDNIYANGGCLPNAWGDYPWAFGICLISFFLIFVSELFAYRIGSNYLQKIGINMETDAHHRQGDGHRHANGNENEIEAAAAEEKMIKLDSSSDASDFRDTSEDTPAGAQLIGVAILEFGVMFHSVIIGLTLSLATDEFNTLFIVIIFHQMFEGLGLGSRLAFLKLPPSWNWIPFTAALAYSLMTPIGMAIGLGARTSISMDSTQASIASGVLDSISAGILLYTAAVELIAHEFIFNPEWRTCSLWKLLYAITCFALGAGLMALLGKWA